MAQLALTVAGALVGNAILPGLGASLGALAGSALGTVLFPRRAQVPPLPDAFLQRSSYGAFLPIVYGSVRVPAIITDGADQFTKHEGDAGGKGGGSQPTPGHYSVDWLAATYCESRGDHSFGRTWFNGRLVGNDVTNDGELPKVSYDGAADQQPDPTEESFRGAGNVSAFRGVARDVYTDLDLSETGNAMPQINREIIKGEVETNKPIEIIDERHDSAHQFPGGNAYGEIGNPAIVAWPAAGAGDIKVLGINDTPPGTVYRFDAATLAYLGSAAAGAGDVYPKDVSAGSGPTVNYRGVGYYRYSNDSTVPLWGCQDFRVDEVHNNPAFTNLTGPPLSTTEPVMTGSGPYVVTGTNFLSGSGMTTTDRVHGFSLSQNQQMLFVAVCTAAQAAIDRTKADKWYQLIDGVVSDSGTINPPVANIAKSGSAGSNAQLNVAMWENNYVYCWACVLNIQEVFVYWINPDTKNFELAPAHVTTETNPAVGGVVLTGDNTTGVDNTPPAGSIYAFATGRKALIVYWHSLWIVERQEVVSGQIRLKDIVADVHTRCNDLPENYDVTELIDIVRGFAVLAPATGRQIIEALAPIFHFTYVDSDTAIKYVKLGKPSILAIPDENLCAHDENGSEIPSPLQVILGNDAELPAQIWLRYMDVNADYQTGAQQWHRQHTKSKITQTIETAVVLTAEEAKRIVDAIGERALREADIYTWYTLRGTAVDGEGYPLPYTSIEPSDVVTVKGLDLRVTRKSELMATGIIKWEGVRSHPGAIIQTGAGSGESEGVPTQEIPTPQETELELLDIPLITDESQQGVIHVAMAGADRRSWRGANLMKAVDGTNYSTLLTSATPDTIGEALTALPPFGGGNIVDEVSYVDVLIHPGGGELTSCTRDALLGGANLCMVGAEMIQFMAATLTDTRTYRLRRLLRGVHGTEWAMRGHAIGDLFVVLPTAVDIEALHAEYGRTIPYKAVTLGRSIATATAENFTSQGVSRAPYAPVHLGGGFVVNGAASDYRMRWTRRARINNAWLPYVDVPLDESSEKYRVRIWEDGTYQAVAREIIVQAPTDFTAGDPYAQYSEADQTTDFGSPLATHSAWSVAQWGVLGWGYEAFSDGSLAGLPLFIPDGPPGYVPPNPDPADGVEITIDWATFPRVYTGSIGPDVRFRFKTTTGSSDSTVLVKLAAAEYNSPPTSRRWALSTIAGDMVGTFAEPYSRGYGTPSVTAGFTVGSHSIAGYPQVPHNTTIYLNVATEATTAADVQMFCDLINRPA